MNLSFIVPQWPAPENVVAGVSTRQGGVSEGAYKSLNLAGHVNDNPEHVAINRQKLMQYLNLPAEPFWLNQVHGINAVHLPGEAEREADAAFTETANTICMALTADCLPLLVCNQQGTEVAAIHAGWKGLALGVVEATIKKMQSQPQDLMVWLGPAISQKNYEVGQEVFDAFVNLNKAHEHAFIKAEQLGHYHANLYEIARQKLAALGIKAIYGGDLCTYQDQDLFFSARRDGIHSGRIASLIYFK